MDIIANCQSRFKKALGHYYKSPTTVHQFRNYGVSVFIVIEDNGPYLSISIHGIARQKTSALRTEVLWRPLHKGGGLDVAQSGQEILVVVVVCYNCCSRNVKPLGHQGSG